MKSYKYLLLLFLAIIIFGNSYAQKYKYSGKIFDSNKNPLYYAAVNLKGTAIYDLTDEDGQYTLKDIVPGKYTLYVTILGYQNIEKEIEITKDYVEQNFYLQESTLALDEVVVTAKVSQSKEGSTTYKIGTDAIQQIQPISVSDILQLVPGNQVSSSNLNGMAQADLRNAGDYTDINSFGTAVIVDGNQLSNDGNMQTEGFVETANKGIDLREISAANIESVEVVSGVPSAKYGNITSGAIIIKRKAGYTPYHFSFNSTPNSYQLGVNKGFKLKNGGFLNADGDYTYSNSQATSRKRYYQRINAGLRWTKELSEDLEWNNNVYVRYGLSFDGQRKDPDEIVVNTEMENESHNFTFSTNGSLNLFGTTSYSVNANYSNQYSYRMSTEAGPIPIIESLEEGTYVTNFSPITFQQRTETYGEPVNINGNIDANQTFKTYGFRHNTSIGLSYTYNKNFGKGRVMDDENNAATAMAGARDMNFYNVPASVVYSAYFQDDICLDKENSNHLIKVGLRYDNMLEKYNLLSPRLSFSGRYFEKYRVRLAYGISYRTPSMLQLYPGPKYFDVINLNHYSEEDIRSLAVVTTYIYQPTYENLKPSKGTTLEGGFDFENNGLSVRLTGFYKEIKDGIATNDQLLTFDKVVWEAVDETPGTVPVVQPTDSIVRVSSNFNTFANTITTRTRGLELSANFPKIKATNTTINFSGSYLKTTSENDDLKLRSSASLTGASENRYGVYEQAAYTTYTCRSNLTIAQHIPQIKLMITLITEVNWLYKREVEDYPSPYPVGYYSIDGSYNDIPESERTNEAYADLYYSREFLERTPTPTYFNFHIQVRKETKQGHSFSFYANNFLWYNPTYEDDLNNSIVELNSRVTFGIGFNFKI
ncbi:MAG: TonB-dependent receptor [Bacteroidetes bacterium]|nr:TonB-dependent receptor [Bacteroidota bacterium]